MKNLVRLTVSSNALCAAGPSAHADVTGTRVGVVVGGYYRNAGVCIGANAMLIDPTSGAAAP